MNDGEEVTLQQLFDMGYTFGPLTVERSADGRGMITRAALLDRDGNPVVVQCDRPNVVCMLTGIEPREGDSNV